MFFTRVEGRGLTGWERALRARALGGGAEATMLARASQGRITS